MKNTASLCFVSLTLVLTFPADSDAGKKGSESYRAGVASVDITPDTPIRLSGYGGRRTVSEGVEQRIWCKALALESKNGEPAILVSVDNCAVPGWLVDKVAARLREKVGLPRARLAVSSSHTHYSPCLTDSIPNLFGSDMSIEQRDAVEAYSSKLTGWIEQAALEALDNRQSARLSLGLGQATFAGNRRTKGGPVDWALPVLRVTSRKGELRALVANYACHCTTMQGSLNKVCGDWAGYAQAYIEENHPGATAMITIGCGADSNPAPRGKLEMSKQYGREISVEVERLLQQDWRPLRGKIECRTKSIALPFDVHPTREQWQERAKKDNADGYHSAKQLARLDRGERLLSKLPYLVQTWNFGESLNMVFLPGEVVVDYSLRLKKEFDAERLWVSAYSNDVPAYIPSERVLTEGGYEGGGAMIYYDRPTRFAPGVEGLIVDAVHELTPETFRE